MVVDLMIESQNPPSSFVGSPGNHLTTASGLGTVKPPFARNTIYAPIGVHVFGPGSLGNDGFLVSAPQTAWDETS
jgi:hypothetical protein